MEEISTAEARERLAELINQAAYGGRSVLLTRRGKSMAALVPIDVLTRLEELEERIKQSSGLAASEVTEIKATIPRSNAVAAPLGVDPDRIADICRKHHVAELSLFGSAVRDDFDDVSSDIDLLVDFEPTAQVGFIELGRLEEDLTLLFDRKVDLVPKAGLRPILREEVLASARVLYAA